MATTSKIKNRTQFAGYCLRKLGHPMIKINVTNDQINDCIDDSIQFYNHFHFDATSEVYHKHQITQENIDNRYIDIPDNIVSVKKIVPISSDSYSTSTEALFDPMYQMYKSDLLSFNNLSTSVQYLMQWKESAKMIQLLISGIKEIFDFSVHENRLYLHLNWMTDIAIDDWLVINAERILLNPDEDINAESDVWGDMFLKEYCAALIQLQWGQNLSKYENVQMPGGVVFSGERIYMEAKEKVERIKEEARSVWELPPLMMIG